MDKKLKFSSFSIIMEKLDSLQLELPLPPTKEQKNSEKSTVSTTYSLLSLDGSTKFLSNEMSLNLADLGITSNEFFSREIVEISTPQSALSEKFESNFKDKIKANINKILDTLNHVNSELLPSMPIDWTDFRLKCIEFVEIIDYIENSTSFEVIYYIIDISSTNLANFTSENFNLAENSDFLFFLLNINSFLSFDEVKRNLKNRIY